MLIYVVSGTTGIYDKVNWISKSFQNKEDAEKFVINLRIKIDEIQQKAEGVPDRLFNQLLYDSVFKYDEFAIVKDGYLDYTLEVVELFLNSPYVKQIADETAIIN